MDRHFITSSVKHGSKLNVVLEDVLEVACVIVFIVHWFIISLSASYKHIAKCFNT